MKSLPLIFNTVSSWYFIGNCWRVTLIVSIIESPNVMQTGSPCCKYIFLSSSSYFKNLNIIFTIRQLDWFSMHVMNFYIINQFTRGFFKIFFNWLISFAITIILKLCLVTIKHIFCFSWFVIIFINVTIWNISEIITCFRSLWWFWSCVWCLWRVFLWFWRFRERL